MGTDGMRRVIVNSVGKEVGRLEQQDAIPGKPIQLTIDYDLQAIAEADFANKEGALVAMDARTGEVLAMVSRPTFDPKDFAVRISRGRMGSSQHRSGNAAAQPGNSSATRARLRL